MNDEETMNKLRISKSTLDRLKRAGLIRQPTPVPKESSKRLDEWIKQRMESS